MADPASGTAAPEPRKHRRIFWLALLLALIALPFLMWPAFLRWEHRRTLTAATAFLQSGDLRSAILAARHAIALQPSDPRAPTLLAAIATRTGSPEALLWHQRAADLQPGKAEPLLALAQAALTAREPTTAAQALARLAPADRETAAAHSLFGTIALMGKDWPTAEEHLTAAARLAPADPASILNLATLHLRDPHSPQAETARTELQKIHTLDSARILLNDARARSDTTAALTLATQLHDAPGTTPDDHLRLLEELQISKSPDLDDLLTREQTAAAKDPAHIATLARWMTQHGLAAPAAAWLDQLSPALRIQPILLLLRTQSADAARDWATLRKLTADDTADWQALDFLRFAYAARATVELADGRRGPDFPARWERALYSTAGNPAALTMLASTVQTWGWRTEAADLWWQLARLPAGSRPALSQLWRLAGEMKDTPLLLRAARRIAELEPTNLAAQNNLAYFLLLLGQDLPAAHALAAKNLAQAPTSPGLRTTSLLSLTLQNRHPEALALLAGLPPEMLKAPAVSASAGAALAAAGQPEKARPFLEAARASTDLLPEERALVTHALQP